MLGVPITVLVVIVVIITTLHGQDLLVSISSYSNIPSIVCYYTKLVID